MGFVGGPLPKAREVQEVMWVRPHLYKAQEDAIFCPERYGIIEASTKAGKTVGCLAWIIEQAMHGHEGQNFWWVAPVSRQAAIAYRRAKRGLTKNTFTSNKTLATITLINGATLWFLSGEIPDNLYGEDVFACVVDEASRVREESWHAVRSTLTATKGPIRCIGNVRGRKNWFYRLARKAEAGAKNMHFAKLRAYDAVAAGVLSAEEVEDARAMLPADVFKELYEAEPGEDTGNPFGFAAIKACTQALVKAEPMVHGVDLAKSVDWTVDIGLTEKGQCCFFDRFQIGWMETVARLHKNIGHKPALIDSTGVGDAVVEFIQRQHGSNYEGFKFTATSKQQIMEGLAVAIQHGLISYPQEVADELEEFEYQYTRTGVQYSAPEGFHDDCVCALAVANYKLLHLTGGWALLKHYQSMATTANAPAAPEALPKAAGVNPAPTPEPPQSSVTQAYKDMMSKLKPSKVCAICKEPLGLDYVTDGFKEWHARCYTPPWLTKDLPVAASAQSG
jgi:hypothetical protein